MTKTLSKGNIPFIDKIGYGFGNLSIGVAMQVIGTYLVFFATVILGVPGSLVGLAVGISIFWDAITDPLMGYFSDITRSIRFGRRHLYLIIGSIGIALTVYLIWTIPVEYSNTTKFILIFIYIILFKSSMTIYVTPYTALGAELSNDYNERTVIQSVKTIFFLLGLAFVSVAGLYLFFRPTPDYLIGQLNPQSYRNVGLISSVIVLISTLVCYLTTFKYIPMLNVHQIDNAKGQKMATLVDALKSTFANMSFRYVALCYMFNNLASAILSNIGLHVLTFTFILTSQQIALVIGIQFLLSILSQPIWMMISRKYDKKQSVNLGLLISIIAGLLFLILVIFKNQVAQQPLFFIPYAITAGFGTGALFTIPLSMVADTIDYDELQRGQRFEGFYYGSLTLYYKLSQALAIFIVGIMLDVVRFNASLPQQSEFTLISLGLILSLGSIISFVFAYISLKKYPLNEAIVRNIQAKIKLAKQDH